MPLSYQGLLAVVVLHNLTERKQGPATPRTLPFIENVREKMMPYENSPYSAQHPKLEINPNHPHIQFS